MEKKYGLEIRVPPSLQKKQALRPPLPKPAGFADDDDDDVEKEISRHATKNKSLKETEQQHKKALEEDPSVFDYDGVYDEMKEKDVRPRAQDRQERKEAAMKEAELLRPEKRPQTTDRSEAGPSSSDAPARMDEKHSDEALAPVFPKSKDPIPRQPDEQPAPGLAKPDHHCRTQEAVAAALERFMARKKAKEHYSL